MRILLWLVVAGLAWADEVKLAAHWTAGERYEVSEDTLLDSKVKATVTGVGGDPTGKTSGSGKYIEHKQREYLEEVQEAAEGHVKLTRTYSTAIKESLKPSGATKTSEKTGLTGRAVTITRDGNSQQITSDAGPVIGDNANDATFVDQVLSLLPKNAVKPGQTWDVDAEALGKAIFHEGYNPALMHVSAKGKLIDLSGKEGDRTAKIALDWSVKLDKVAGSVGIEYHLAGEAKFHVDHGRFLALEANGPVELELGDGGTTMHLEGTMHVSYRAKAAK